MGPFSRLLIEARARKRLSQTDIEQRAKIPQTTYSHWEQGTRLPTPDRDLSGLAKLLGIDEGLLTDQLRAQRNRPRRARQSGGPIPLGEFLDDQQDFLSGALEAARGTHDTIDLWLLSLEALPIAESEDVVSTWVENLTRGINYKLVWPLDLLQANAPSLSLDRLVSALKQIADDYKPKQSSGRVIHYGIRAFSSASAPTRLYERNKSLFDSLRAFQVPGNAFRELTLDDDLRHRLLSYISSIGTLAVYYTADMETRVAKYSGIKRAALGLRQPNGTIWFSIRPDEETLFLSHLVFDLDKSWERQKGSAQMLDSLTDS